MFRTRAVAALLPMLALASFAGGAPPATFQPLGPIEALPSGIATQPTAVTRPIFALPVAASPAKKTTTPTTPSHRQLLPLVPSKKVAAPSTADAKNPAPPPLHGSSSVPSHRRALGW